MAEGNWIKLYRKMVDDPIFVNSTGPQVKVLLTVMFLAAWTPKKWDVLGHEFTIQPGEVFISTRDLADRAGDDVCTGQRILDTKSQKLDVKKINK